MRAPAPSSRRLAIALASFPVVLALLVWVAMVVLTSGDGTESVPQQAAPISQDFAAVESSASSAASPAPSPSAAVAAPDDRALRITVPGMARVERVPVVSSHPSDEAALRRGALHVEGTGFPWQRGSNTYIAGHRLGFPGTASDRLFWDLGRLADGDAVLLEDSRGRVYEYAVFREMVVGPKDVSVTAPVEGKSVVTLQTCTLPDYSRRLVVQAELVDGPPASHAELGHQEGGRG